MKLTKLTANLASSGVAILLLSLLGCSSTAPQPTVGPVVESEFGPTLVPHGWIADFSYEEPLAQYLAGEFAKAESANKEPFVFFFAEWCKPCVRIRRRTGDADLARVFKSKRMVMINYDYVREIMKDQRSANGPEQLSVVPAIAPIRANGQLGYPMITGSSWRDTVPGDDRRTIQGYFDGIELVASLRDKGLLSGTDRRGCDQPRKKTVVPADRLMLLTAASVGSPYWLENPPNLAFGPTDGRGRGLPIRLLDGGEPSNRPRGSTYANCATAEYRAFTLDTETEEWKRYETENPNALSEYVVAFPTPEELPAIYGWAAVDTRDNSIYHACGCFRD